MTASVVKGTTLTAQLITSPNTPQKDIANGIPLKVRAVTQELATTSIDEIGDIVHLLAIPSSACVHDIRVLVDDIDTNGTPLLAYDLGLYNGPDKFSVPISGTVTEFAAFGVIDADLFASALTSGQSAVTTAVVNQRFEANAAVGEIATVASRLWELALMDKDPNKTFVISITITAAAATAAAGTMTLQVFHS